jgi:hypothetical protein
VRCTAWAYQDSPAASLSWKAASKGGSGGHSCFKQESAGAQLFVPSGGLPAVEINVREEAHKGPHPCVREIFHHQHARRQRLQDAARRGRRGSSLTNCPYQI